MDGRDSLPAPSADELAAIAAAYLIVARAARTATPPPVQPSRWALAARLPLGERLRAARGRSNWAAAVRLDG